LKTININLIGDLGKASKINLKEAKKVNSSDARNQIIVWILIIGVLIVFTASFGGWILVKQMSSNLDKNLIKLNKNLNTLREQETQLSNFRNDLKKEKEITELKIVIQKQLNSSFFPWSSVLQEIAAKIPKDIIVLKIEKEGTSRQSSQQDDSLKLKISGLMPTNKQTQPLMTISLFIFNLNEDQNALLSDAKISKLDFNDKTRAYEFEIETSINNGAVIARSETTQQSQN
jgi:Tfp pilus assembly protein PilN